MFLWCIYVKYFHLFVFFNILINFLNSWSQMNKLFVKSYLDSFSSPAPQIDWCCLSYLHLTSLLLAATPTWGGGSAQISHEPKTTNHPDRHTLLLRHKTRKDTTAKNCVKLLCSSTTCIHPHFASGKHCSLRISQGTVNPGPAMTL